MNNFYEFQDQNKLDQFEPNFANVSKCKDCGSFNISKDIKTNKIICKDCNDGKLKEDSKVDFEELSRDKREKDLEEIAKRQSLGEIITQPDDTHIHIPGIQNDF